MKIFLDDIRDPSMCISYMHKRIGSLNPIYNQDWFTVRNYDQFVDAIVKYHNEITHISFDHDLAEAHYHDSMYSNVEDYEKNISHVTEKTGYECAQFLKNFYQQNNLNLPIMFVHSMNPVGTQRIIELFKS